MTQFGTEIDTILAKPAKDWTNEETKTIGNAMKEHGKETVQRALLDVRGGDKPPVEVEP